MVQIVSLVNAPKVSDKVVKLHALKRRKNAFFEHISLKMVQFMF